MSARDVTSPTIVHIGTRRPERPTPVTDCVRATCIAAKLTAATAPSHGNNQVDFTASHKVQAMISAATTLAAAKKGAR